MYNQGPKPVVPFFSGPLSQWTTSPFVEVVKGEDNVERRVEYVCAEQYMMAKKALLFGDKWAYWRIMSSRCPSYMKEIGRMVRNFNQEKWDKKKWGIVYDGNMLKFSQSPSLREYLLSFPHDCEFAECSPVDCEWGIGLGFGSQDVFDRSKWRGRNKLGKIITKVRDVLLGLPAK